MNRLKLLSQAKARSGEQTIVLFRIGEYFEAYDVDAVNLAKLLELELTDTDSTPMVRISINDEHQVTKQILSAGLGFCISESIDSEGNFTLNQTDVLHNYNED